VFANLRKAIVFVVAVHVPIVGLSILPVLLGWPMLLMPVHILFLQLIIDPTCSVVFEAEPIEPDAMTARPRSPEARLFDAAVLTRGLWQGTGLLVILLAAYAGVRSFTGSDDMARALTFTVLVLANLGLIQANRSWGRALVRGPGASNATFGWIALATLALLGCVLGIAEVRRLFAFAALPPTLLLAGVGAAAVSLLWFETVKQALGAMHRTAPPHTQAS
jgi:Ca2+-transporting ATPase